MKGAMGARACKSTVVPARNSAQAPVLDIALPPMVIIPWFKRLRNSSTHGTKFMSKRTFVKNRA